MSTTKKTDTGYRILEVLKLLLECNMTKGEIISKLSDKDGMECVYTPEAFIKYFNTYERLGLKVARNRKDYTIVNSLVSIDVTEEEKTVFLEMLKNKRILLTPSEEEKLKNVCIKLVKYTNGKITKEEIEEIYREKEKYFDEQQGTNIEIIRKMTDEKFLTKLEYENSKGQIETLTVELKSLQEKDGEVIVGFYIPTKGRNKKLKLRAIKSLTQLPKKAGENNYILGVSFELYGRLAHLYKLKKSEKVTGFSDGKITVINYEEDREILLKRLLRYGNNCKIISPKEMQDDLMNLTEKMLANYD